MTKTDWVFSEADHSLHQEFSTQDSAVNSRDNTNPVELIIDFPASFNVTRGRTGDESFSQLSVNIPSGVMDKMAIAWCKKRGLHGALGGPVGLEFGSADCEYDVHISQSIEVEDAEMVKLVKERAEQPEIEAKLEFDNIFEVVADSKKEAQRLQQESDELIMDRDVYALLELLSKSPTLSKRAAFTILNHIKARQYVDDEASLQSTIEEALLAVAIR